MAKAWKKLVPVGTHVSPQGIVDVTPQRVKHWIGSLKAIREAGNRIPVCWGHSLAAIPGPEDFAFFRSRYNGGYIEDARQSADGGMEGLVDVPGAELDGDGNLMTEVELPDRTKVKSAIREVSVGIGDNWTDGQGKTWSDIILHAAMTPLPVWAGQDGFKPAGSAEPSLQALSTTTAKLTHFSLSTAVQRMATNTGATMADEMTTTEETTVAATETTPEKPADKTEEELLTEAMTILARCGIKVPDDTTTENFLERLVVAGTAHEHTKEHEAGKEDKENPMATEAPIVQETPPVMMSTDLMKNHKDPIVRALWIDKEASVRGSRVARIRHLQAHRGLKPDVAEALVKEATTVCMSLLPDGRMKAESIDEKIALLEASLAPGSDLMRRQLGTAIEQPNPHAEAVEGEKKKLEDLGDRLCRNNGLAAASKN